MESLVVHVCTDRLPIWALLRQLEGCIFDSVEHIITVVLSVCRDASLLAVYLNNIAMSYQS